MYKELKQEFPDTFKQPTHGDLQSWCNQGVLLLNATLTVRAHTPMSHAQWGWSTFTDSIIAYINANSRNKVVFMLWGSHAQKKGGSINKKKHLVLSSAHPSPLSAHRGFLGNGHFKKANDFLQEQGLEPIRWGDLN
jgi:uracil-DNA glycosylase